MAEHRSHRGDLLLNVRDALRDKAKWMGCTRSVCESSRRTSGTAIMREGDPPGDVLDRVLLAADQPERSVRVAGYREALAAIEAQEERRPSVAALARARALCGLARDGEVGLETAELAVEDAVSLGEACAALESLAAAYAALGQPDRVVETIRRVPKTCFRGIHGLWRVWLWNLRARAEFDLGRDAEGFKYAAKIAERLTPEDPEELIWVAPHQTIEALVDRTGRGGPSAERARVLLQTIAARVDDLEEWFGEDAASAIATAVRAQQR